MARQSPIVQIVDIGPEELDQCNGSMLIQFNSVGGKNRYYVFVPFTLVIRECQKAGIVYLGPNPSFKGAT